MTRILETRLHRLERAAGSDLPLHATVIIADTAAEAERALAERVADGTHRLGWPLVTLTAATPRSGHPS